MARYDAPQGVYGDLPVAPSVKQAAALLGCHPHTVYAMIERGDLAAVRLGRLLRIPRHALLELLSVRRDEDGAA